MIIPVRCMACGKVLADKWDAYSKRCAEAGVEAGGDDGAAPREGAAKDKSTAGEKTPRGVILDQMGIVNICCRIAMQTHVDMSLII